MQSESRLPRYPDHSKLMEYRDESGRSFPIQTAKDWSIRRNHLLLGMQELMGDLPAESCPLDRRTHSTVDTAHYTRHKIDYQPEPGDRVPGYLLLPKDTDGPRAAVMCLHQTTQIGKDEPAGLGGLPTLHYAHELANRGYVCLVPDYPSLGEYTYDFDKDRHASGSIKGILNHKRGVDLLCSLSEVDATRIGTIGHSLGGHNSMFLAVFDERVKAIVSCCGFTALCHYYGGDLTGWTGPRYCPRMKMYPTCKDVPFDFHELVASFAPRAFMTVSPLYDSNFENIGVREVIESAKQVYSLLGAADKLVAHYPDDKHQFADEERAAAYTFLDKHLQHSPRRVW